MANVKEMNRKKHKAEGLMVDLMYIITEELMYKIKSGEASSQDMRNAISLLKDNGVTVDITQGEPLSVIQTGEELPFESDRLKAVGE